MTQVALNLPDYLADDDRWIDVTVAVDLSADELKTLTLFVTNIDRVRSSTLLQRGMGGFAGFNFGTADGLTIRSGQFTDAEMRELLHLLRLVTLEEERASFYRVAALVGRRVSDAVVRKFLKVARRVYRDGEASMFFQVHLNGEPLLDASILDTWLNGTQYHSDEEKAAAWSRLESALGAPNAAALVRAQLHSKVAALFNVDYLARQILGAAEQVEPVAPADSPDAALRRQGCG